MDLPPRALTRMQRDDELFELTQRENQRFFPGGFRGREQALKLAVPEGFSVEWSERRFDGEKRSRGLCSVRDPGGGYVTNFPERWKTRPVAEVWQRVHELVPAVQGAIEPPQSFDAAVALASAPAEMLAAEQLVREAFARAAPFGVGPCGPIRWRATHSDTYAKEKCSREAFRAIDKAGIDALGYGRWKELGGAADKLFSFSSRLIDIPPLLSWAHADFYRAVQFDEARRLGAAPFAGLDSPFEPLVRVALLGIGVQVMSENEVVLGVHVN